MNSRTILSPAPTVATGFGIDWATPLRSVVQTVLSAPADIDADACGRMIATLGTTGDETEIFLSRQGMGALVHDVLSRFDDAHTRWPALLERLRHRRLTDAAIYAVQRAGLRELDEAFLRAGIAYAVLKGAHVRELVYTDPALRPAADIDVLVVPADRVAAARVLRQLGFEPQAEPENISHEMTFSRSVLDIDLHWDLLRPGRLRGDVADALLSRRVRIGDFHALSDDDAIFLMLVHPAFAKYVNSPHASLLTVADFALLARTRPIDWDTVVNRLRAAGVGVSAWACLTWWSMLLGPHMPPLPPGVLTQLRPASWRARYLEDWLRSGRSTHWIDKGLLIQAGLTLFLHDTPTDAVRAVRGIARARRLVTDPILDAAAPHRD